MYLLQSMTYREEQASGGASSDRRSAGGRGPDEVDRQESGCHPRLHINDACSTATAFSKTRPSLSPIHGRSAGGRSGRTDAHRRPARAPLHGQEEKLRARCGVSL